MAMTPKQTDERGPWDSMPDIGEEKSSAEINVQQQPWEQLPDFTAPQPQKFDLSAGIAFDKEDQEKSSRILRVSDESQLPVDFVERNLDQLEKDIAKKGFNPEKYRQDNPIVSDWLAQNPHYFSAARNDLDFLARIEKDVSAAGDRFQQLVGGGMRTALLMAPEVANLLPAQIRVPLQESIKQSDVADELEMLGESYKSVMAGKQDRVLEQGTTWEDFKDQPLRNLVPYIISTGIVSAPDMAAALINLPGYISMRAGELAQERAVNKGQADATLGDLITVMPTTVAMSALERLGAKGIIGVDEAVRTFGDVPRAVLRSGAIEGGTEFAQEQMEYAVTTLSTDVDFDIAQSFERGIAGAVGGAGYGAAIRTTTAPVQAFMHQRKAQQRQRFFEALGGDSEMREKLPSKMQEAVDKLTKNGPLETMYVPIDAHNEYWQSQGVDPREAAEQAFGSASYYNDGAASGMMEVPTAAYAAFGAGTEANEFYSRNTTFNPQDMTDSEFEAVMRRMQEDDAEVLQDVDAETPQQSVYNAVYGQIQPMYTPDVADKYARYMSIVFDTLAQRTGTTATELYNSYDVNIRREIPQAMRDFGGEAEVRNVLEMMRTGTIPTEDEVYGMSIVDMLRTRGIRDDGGEIANRDLDVGQRGRRLINRATAEWTLDDAAEWAYEQGIIQENDQTAFMEALDAELQGERFETETYNPSLANVREFSSMLEQQLDELGVSMDNLTDDQIIDALFRGGDLPTGQELEQSADIASELYSESAIRYVQSEIEQPLSSEYVVDVTPEQFLSLAETIEEPSQEKLAALEGVDKFDDVPYLMVELQDGALKVVGHEGRHRAIKLSERGIESFPVRLMLRGTPKYWSRITDMPQVIISEDGNIEQPIPPATQSSLLGGTILAQSAQTQTPEFQRWSEGAEVIEPDEINDTDFSGDGPYVLRAYHGTTNEFDYFDASVKGNMEGQFGAVNYFTSAEMDAESNYLDSGPDLTTRIEMLAERIESEQEIDSEEALALARQQLAGDTPQVLEVFIKTKKPFVIGDNHFREFVDLEEIQNQAIELVAENNDISEQEVRDNMDEYEDEVDEARWDVDSDTENELVSAIEQVAYQLDIDASEILGNIYDVASEGATNEAIEEFLRGEQGFAYAEDPETGDLVGYHAIAMVIKELGYDSIILKNAEERFSNMNMTPGTAHIHVFDEYNSNIKSATANRGTFDPNDPVIYNQQKQQAMEDPNLLVVHNINPQGVIFANELGGLAAPSLAVARVDKGGFTSFGEISLIASPSILSSSKARTFDADVYTPRQPRAELVVDEKRFREFAEKWDEAAKEIDTFRVPDADEISRDGMNALIHNPAAKYDYLKSVGAAPKPVKRKVDKLIQKISKLDIDRWNVMDSKDIDKLTALIRKNAEEQIATLEDERSRDLVYERFFDENGDLRPRHIKSKVDEMLRVKESGGIDGFETGRKIDKIMRQKKHRAGFEEYASNAIGEIVKGKRLFKGFTESGNRKYAEYTLDAVVREMTKKLQSGEDFNYGAGSTRAAVANEMRTIEQVQERRDQILSTEDFKAIKEEANDRFMDALDALKEHYKFDSSSFGYYDDAGKALAEGRSGWNETFDMNEDSEQIIADILDYLKNMPTEYFETKIQRAVSFDEFQAAVVPTGTNPETLRILKDAGLKIYKYNPDKISRADKVKQVAEKEKVLFQKDDVGTRGSIRFDPTGGLGRSFTITIGENADLSTFLHESGHLFLEIMMDLAEQPGAPQQIVDDVQTLFREMGVESRSQVGRDQHEMFAEWTEKYLAEGKAPVAELRRLFVTFWSWLKRIYRNIDVIGITKAQLSDDVRRVMDRMVATDDMLDAQGDTEQLYKSFGESGMTPDEWAEYLRGIEEVRYEAQEQVATEVMDEYEKTQKKWWKERRREVRKRMEKQVSEERVYRALDVLQRGKAPDGGERPEGVKAIKLSKDSIVDLMGEGFLKRLPRPYVYTRDGGMEVQSAASMLGYDDANQLLSELATAQNKKERINQLTDGEMQRLYGDENLDATLPQMVLGAIHNDRMADVLEIELRSLGRKASKRVTPRQLVREQAERIIDGKQARMVKPHLYRRAEQKAANAAFEAAMAGDNLEALRQKQMQMLNFELFRAAQRAQELETKLLDKARGLMKTSAQERIGKSGSDYLEQINGILEQYEFKRTTDRELSRRESLRAWIAEKEREGEFLGEEIDVPAAVLDRANAMNYRELPIAEMRGIYDLLRQIEHFARMKNKLLANQKRREREQAEQELISAVEANMKKKKKMPLSTQEMKLKERMTSLAREMDASLLKMEQVVDWLDDGDVDGPWHEILFNPVIEAQAKEQEYTELVTSKVTEALMDVPKETRNKMLDRVGVLNDGTPITRRSVLGMALNVGNESNMLKLMKGYGLTEAQLKTWLDILTKEEWDFVQRVWDTLEEIYPDIAALEKELRGIEPEKVEAKPVQTKFGEYAGGYYPVIYDFKRTEQGEKQLASNVGGLMDTNYVRSTTPKGHTKKRVENFAAPIDLNIDRLSLHIAGVVKDLTHRKWLIDANWVVNNKKIMASIEDAMGVEYRAMFKDWVRNTVNDRNVDMRQTLGTWNAMFETLRLNMMVATMGIKATTMISQIAGLGPSVEVVGGREGDGLKWMRKAFTEIAFDQRKITATWQMIKEKSPEMRYRLQNKDRDIRNKLRQLSGKSDLLSQIQEISLQGIGYADLLVTIPTWMAGYRKALSQGKSEAAAIKEGDRAVRLSQGSGGAKDLAAVQSRSGQIMRLLTMYYTPFNAMHNRLRNAGHEFGGIRDLPKAFFTVWWATILPAVMGELLVGRAPEEDEDVTAWLLKTVTVYASLGIPFVRDIMGAATSGFGYSFTPLQQVGTKTSLVLKDIGELATGDKPKDEALQKLALDTFRASGYWLGIPTSQLEITGGYMYDLATGEDDSEDAVRKFLYRRDQD